MPGLAGYLFVDFNFLIYKQGTVFYPPNCVRQISNKCYIRLLDTVQMEGTINVSNYDRDLGQSLRRSRSSAEYCHPSRYGDECLVHLVA